METTEFKNSEAQRARNARKRAKLKAKARGQSPHAYSVRMTARTTSVVSIEDHGSLKDRATRWAPTELYTAHHSFVSSTLNSTGFEVTEHVREYIQVFTEGLPLYPRVREAAGYLETSSAECYIRQFTVFVVKDGEERATTWEDVTDVETLAAEVVAAVEGFLQ